MGRVQLYIAASLDGFIADVDGGIGWLTAFERPGEDHGFGAFMKGVGAMALGATTYEQLVAEHGWPHDDVPAWVFTRRDLHVPDGADVRLTAAPPADAVEEMRAAAGDRNVWLVGGGELVASFLDAGLVDDVLLFAVPVVLGAGVPLWRRAIPSPLRLVEATPYDTGLVGLRYEIVHQARCSAPGPMSAIERQPARPIVRSKSAWKFWTTSRTPASPASARA